MRRFGKIALVGILELAILWGIVRAISLQTRRVEAAVSEISDMKDPSPFRVALLGHLDKIHLSVLAYLRSPDPAPLKQVADSQRDFENSLPEFERQNRRLFPPMASEEIRRTYEMMKSSVEQTLSVSAKRVERRAVSDENFKRMLYLIESRIRPLLRKGDPDSQERLQTLLNVENQLRAWQQHLAQAWTEPSAAVKALAFESDNKGETHLNIYEQNTLLPAERKPLRELETLWKANGNLARQNFALETVQGQALDRLKADSEQIRATLNMLLPPMQPEDLERRKQGILKTIRYRLITAGLIGLAGAASVVITILGAYRLGRFNTLLAPRSAKASSPDTSPTLEIDLKGTITSWSKTAERLYGYSASEIRGQSIATLFAADSEINRLHHQMQSSAQTSFETTHKGKNGASIPVHIEFRRITGPTGRMTAIGLSCTRHEN